MRKEWLARSGLARGGHGAENVGHGRGRGRGARHVEGWGKAKRGTEPACTSMSGARVGSIYSAAAEVAAQRPKKATPRTCGHVARLNNQAQHDLAGL